MIQRANVRMPSKPKRQPAWKGQPISQNQINLMQANGIPFDSRMTRGEASAAITKYQDEAPHPFSEEAFEA